MAKVKYIIILTLVLVIGLLFLQLQNHKQLTNQLLNENNHLDRDHLSLNKEIDQLKEKVLNLENKIENLENNNTTLQNKIIELKDDIILMEEDINLKYLKPKDINYTIDLDKELYKEPPKFETNETNETKDSEITPSVTLDEENKIDTIKIEYKENF